jgi:hypothetical protein
MDREILKGFFRIGVFVGIGGLIMIFFQSPDSPEYVISLCSMMIGGFIMLGVILLLRLMR